MCYNDNMRCIMKANARSGKVELDLCPFCKSGKPNNVLADGDINVWYCDNCHYLWEVFRGKVTRLRPETRENPETKIQGELCPVCWRKMEPNYESWRLICPDPICGYSKPLGGIGSKQAATRNEYRETRQQVFELIHSGKPVPKVLAGKLKSLQAEYGKFRRFDPHPL